MKVLVTGGRTYSDRDSLYAALDAAKPTQVIVGDATGADAMAWSWCVGRQIPCRRFWADWNKHGKAAGPIRNQEMIDVGQPDLVIAFAGGRGTADLVRRAAKAGIPIKHPDTAQDNGAGALKETPKYESTDSVPDVW